MYIDKNFLLPRLLYRENDSHKGDYGHLCLVCGCDLMPGAASLATAAALKSGCGLVTLHTSAFAAQISAVSNPSAMLSIDPEPCFSDCSRDWNRYDTVAVGPGLGKNPETVSALARLLSMRKAASLPLVLDADAINIIAGNRQLLETVPAGSILTPHDGELARLISWDSEEEKAEKVHGLCNSLGCHIVSKGYHTRVYVAGQKEVYVNTTGNPGMAKGGSGDVLTGLIGGLLARGYSSINAALMGVWLHGYAGDLCTEKYGPESYSSRDLVDCLHLAFRELYG